MVRDFNSNSNDMNPDTGRGAARDTRADFGGDLAGNDGVDLNAGDASKADDGFAKAMIMDTAPPPDIYEPPSAIYESAPADVQDRPNFQDQYPDWNITDGTTKGPTIEDGDPAPESNVENYPDAEYADEPPDPP